jgi:hypothetical protein
MPYNNQPFPASDDNRASLFISDSVVIYPCSHSLFNCMWFHLILCDFLTLKTFIYEGTKGMKPLVTEFVT